MRENPFRLMDGWFWTDEQEELHGPYPQQSDALRAILQYMAPTRWQRIKTNIKEAVAWIAATLQPLG